MIDGFTLTKDLVQFHKGFDAWEEAITFAAKPLLKQKFIESSYLDAMISSVKEFGPYIVIAPNVAMPHARPEAGSNSVGFSVTVFENPVSFGETDDLQAQLFVTLSCVNAETHLKMLQALVMVLGDDEKMKQILAATTKEEIVALFE
jgi:mannitol/fructose-specific phosphotransferase system IIA component (Ntr-type)